MVVQDGPGFLVNRLLFPYMNEALVLLSEGVPIEFARTWFAGDRVTLTVDHAHGV